MKFWKYIKDNLNNQSNNLNSESSNQQSSNNSNNESQNEQSSNNSNSESQNEQSSNNLNSESQSKQPSNNSNNESQNEQSSNNLNSESQSKQPSNNSNSESQSKQPSNNLNSESQDEQSSNNSNSESQSKQPSNNSNSESSNQQSSNNSNNELQSKQSSNDSNSESQGEQPSNDLNNESQSKQSGNDSNSESSNKQSNNNSNSESENNTQNNTEFNPKDTLKSINDRKEGLQKLRDKLQEYAKRREKKLAKQNLNKNQSNKEKIESKESKEEEYKLSEQTNKFLDKLKNLPSFNDRDRGAGYSVDTEGYTELPDSLIRTLITKFLNQRFCKKNTDLNIRSNSLEKSKGFYKWEVKDVVVHLKTHQITRVLDDKYGYQYAEGKNENVPLSFYFDMSGSMSKYTNMLAVIAIELLKKDVKVLIGYNERVNVQIEKIDKNMDVDSLAKFLSSAGYYGDSSSLIKNSQVTYKFVNQNIDNYLIERKAEKCVVFSDFDPRKEIINLSHEVKTYWFCFEDSYEVKDIGEFSGFCYKVRNATDIMNGLIKVNENRFEALIYTEEIKKQTEKEENEKQKSKGGM